MVVRNAASLSLINIAQEKEITLTQFGSPCEKLHWADLISAKTAGSAKDDFEEFTKSVVSINKEELTHFVIDRLDKLMFACLNGQKHFELFRKICIIVFTLPYSQCAVEHGFSVKKELLVENI